MSGVEIHKTIVNGAVAGAVMFSVSAADAENLDAGFVLNKMNADQRVSYIQGVIEGLAYSRFLKDRPDETGYNCIQDWFQNDQQKTWKVLKAWLARHPDKPVPVLLHIITKKECGE